MKILFTGGGSGGHFYPIIAIAEELNRLAKENRLIHPKLYFMAPDPYDPRLLADNGITFERTPAGKLRIYFSPKNLTDLFKTAAGIARSLLSVFRIFPDVIMSKGGYGSFPALVAARIFRIPVVIHESDSVPGRVSLWAGKFAGRIAVSFPEAAEFFPKEKVAYTGNPIRRELRKVTREGAREFLKLEAQIPTIVVLGGSQGAELINGTILAALPSLVERYQIIHQIGKRNFAEAESSARVALERSPYRSRYKPFDYLNTAGMKMAGGAADLVVSRAGSTIFEIAIWGIPSIIIPITESHDDHQRKNAYGYEKAGACVVIEEKNMTPAILLSEIQKILSNPARHAALSEGARRFSRPDAAEKIARAVLSIALEHEA